MHARFENQAAPDLTLITNSLAGNFTRDVSVDSYVDWQINTPAGAGYPEEIYNGTWPYCDTIMELSQPPNSSRYDKTCPPTEGPALIVYGVPFMRPVSRAPVSEESERNHTDPPLTRCHDLSHRAIGASDTMQRLPKANRYTASCRTSSWNAGRVTTGHRVGATCARRDDLGSAHLQTAGVVHTIE